MEQQLAKEMEYTLSKRLEAGDFRNRAVFLFGHCNITEKTADYLLSHDVTPSAILDNNISKQGQTYRDIPISAPEIILGSKQQESIVLIAVRFYEQMKAQLRQIGYDGDVIQVVKYSSFTEYSTDDETFERKSERMQRGIEALGCLRERYPDYYLVICPHNAIGDVYWAMAFLPAYAKKQSIADIAVVVVGDGCRQVAEMFFSDVVKMTKQEEIDELIQAVIFTHDSNCFVAHHDRLYTDNAFKLLDKRFVSFIDYYKYVVYGLNQDALPAAPVNIAQADSLNGMIEGKSIILSPYAKSVVKLPDTYWGKLADDYIRRGYCVFTNITGEEKPIRETEPLNLPISQMISAAEHAGTFIGIRSGLCDVLHTARCRKTVVFPKCFYSSTVHSVADFFALPGWESVIY